jgi:hypothetical protein
MNDATRMLQGLLTEPFTMFVHDNEVFATPGYWDAPSTEMTEVSAGWEFEVTGTASRVASVSKSSV